jgi:hypothetical protein
MKPVLSFISSIATIAFMSGMSGLAGCGGTCSCPQTAATAEPEPAAAKQDAPPEKAPAAAETPAPQASTEAPWWNIPYPSRFEAAPTAPKLDFIRVREINL